MNKKNEKKKECFDNILEKCFRKIEKSASLDQSNCYFEVPEFVLGFPLYNINECIVHILQKLKDNGFHVQYFFPRVIHVTWKSEHQQVDSFAQNLLMIMNTQSPMASHHIPLQTNPQLTLQHTPSYEHPVKDSVSLPVMAKKKGRRKDTKPIAEFKPSGKFVLNLT